MFHLTDVRMKYFPKVITVRLAMLIKVSLLNRRTHETSLSSPPWSALLHFNSCVVQLFCAGYHTNAQQLVSLSCNSDIMTTTYHLPGYPTTSHLLTLPKPNLQLSIVTVVDIVLIQICTVYYTNAQQLIVRLIIMLPNCSTQ